MITNLLLSEIGFRHGLKDKAGPFICDALNMGNAFLALYNAAKNKVWLVRAEQTARFIKRNFQAPVTGFITASESCEVCAAGDPAVRIDENISLARFALNLYLNKRENEYKEIAEEEYAKALLNLT